MLAFHITERGLVVDWTGARVAIQADWFARVALLDKLVEALWSDAMSR